ncbi:MAG: Thymidylate kinase, partial [uncultured Acidimicrobiales bacterium]
AGAPPRPRRDLHRSAGRGAPHGRREGTARRRGDPACAAVGAHGRDRPLHRVVARLPGPRPGPRRRRRRLALGLRRRRRPPRPRRAAGGAGGGGADPPHRAPGPPRGAGDRLPQPCRAGLPLAGRRRPWALDRGRRHRRGRRRRGPDLVRRDGSPPIAPAL